MSWVGVSPVIDAMPMMGTPYFLLIVFGLYLWIVLYLGPRFMKNRPAYDIHNFVRFYNIYQIAGCIFSLVHAQTLGFSFHFAYKCDTAKNWMENPVSLNLYWWFIIFRASEFVETLFFVLRKKQNQVSFLHIYHHIAVVSLLWTFLKYGSSLNGIFIGMLNSSVHIIMYSYYFLSSFKSMRFVTDLVKQYITIIQITQLLALVAHCLIAIFICGEGLVYYLQVANLVLLVTLFMIFYKDSYNKKKQSKVAE